tara:strand:- start:620 stop:802 length:183 start_codon:yes stop_codon:yes gene_type:complete
MKVTRRVSLTNQETVESILHEASAYGLRDEVDWTAKDYLEKNRKLNIITAYQWAFLDWVK